MQEKFARTDSPGLRAVSELSGAAAAQEMEPAPFIEPGGFITSGALDQAGKSPRLNQSASVKARRQRMLAKLYMEDSAITKWIRAALQNDPDLEPLEIEVETYMGSVKLSGFVNDAIEACNAGAIAAKIFGVIAVENNLVVKKPKRPRQAKIINLVRRA